MSHRVSIKSRITNAPAAKAALQAKGWAFSEGSNELRINDGPMRGATINLRNGEVVGDTDFHRASATDSLGALNQEYMVQLLKQDIVGKGGYIEEQTTQQDGTIRMVANVSFA